MSKPEKIHCEFIIVKRNRLNNCDNQFKKQSFSKETALLTLIFRINERYFSPLSFKRMPDKNRNESEEREYSCYQRPNCTCCFHISRLHRVYFERISDFVCDSFSNESCHCENASD